MAPGIGYNWFQGCKYLAGNQIVGHESWGQNSGELLNSGEMLSSEERMDDVFLWGLKMSQLLLLYHFQYPYLIVHYFYHIVSHQQKFVLVLRYEGMCEL